MLFPKEALFNPKPLDLSEASQIEKLLVDSYQPGENGEEQVERDTELLEQITTEIKAIGK